MRVLSQLGLRWNTSVQYPCPCPVIALAVWSDINLMTLPVESCNNNAEASIEGIDYMVTAS